MHPQSFRALKRGREMRKPVSKKHATNIIEFPGRVHAFTVLLLLLLAATVFTIGLLITEPELPFLIKPPLLLVALTAGLLAFSIVNQMRATKIVLGPASLQVSGPNGSGTYAWGKIEAARVVGACSCFADNPMTPAEKRIGLALFLRAGGEGRVDAAEADAILAVGDQIDGTKFVDAATAITKAVRSRQRSNKPVAAAQTKTRRREQFAQRGVA